jgi:hypothetical protein
MLDTEVGYRNLGTGVAGSGEIEMLAEEGRDVADRTENAYALDAVGSVCFIRETVI